MAVLLAVGLMWGGSSVATADTRLPPEDTPRAAEVCREVAEINTLEKGWMRPSPDYWDGNWLRDAFWTSGYLGPVAGKMALDVFGNYLTKEGQAPTSLGRNGAPSQFHDDESTLIYVIWAARDGGQPQERIARAWNWIRGHVVDGAYYIRPGNFRTWHDTLVFPTRDVSAYNQGLYAVATLSAMRLGAADPAEFPPALAFYRQLYRPSHGYMPASMYLDHRDTSALVGETLARSLYGRSLLDDWMVLATVRSQPRTGPGFMALATRQGGYLDQTSFSPRFPQGRYQNGGSWLLYDVLAWTAARMAGAPEAGLLARKRLELEVATGSLHEYLPTGPVRQMGETPTRGDYAANAYACIATGIVEPQIGRDLSLGGAPR